MLNDEHVFDDRVNTNTSCEPGTLLVVTKIESLRFVLVENQPFNARRIARALRLSNLEPDDAEL